MSLAACDVTINQHQKTVYCYALSLRHFKVFINILNLFLFSILILLKVLEMLLCAIVVFIIFLCV